MMKYVTASITALMLSLGLGYGVYEGHHYYQKALDKAGYEGALKLFNWCTNPPYTAGKMKNDDTKLVLVCMGVPYADAFGDDSSPHSGPPGGTDKQPGAMPGADWKGTVNETN